MHQQKVILVVIIVYAVGIIGTLIPAARDLVVGLTPYNLLFAGIMLMSSADQRKSNFWIFLVFAFLIGYGFEVIGVKTGLIFGEYAYGKTLGFKPLDVPLVIGLNWWMLSYAFGVIARKARFENRLVLSLLGASMMVMMDFLIEPVAVYFDYWQWENNVIPLKNYIGWWLLAFVIQMVFHTLLRKQENYLAIPLIFSQLVYFMSIHIFLI
jgi:putative membrane protein